VDGIEGDAEVTDGHGEAPGTGVARADPALTLSARRLAGSAACLNCGTPLQGPFCHYCGQPDRNFLRFFPVLLRELMEDFLDLDSRFVRTLKPLLFHPGRLTRDYLQGRRYRYTPPLRLYLFTSIAFFVVAAFLSSGVIESGQVHTGSGINITFDNEDDRRQVEEALEKLPPDIRADVEREIETAAAAESGPQDAEDDGFEFRFNDQPWDRETNPVDIPFLPRRFNDWINDEIERSPEKEKLIESNPDLFVDQVFEVLPGTMFVLLPVVALIFKFWYLFAKRYYIEHLILALHNHAFIFMCLLLVLLLDVLGDWFAAAGLGTGQRATAWATYAIAVWVPAYLLVSLRRVYAQGWLMTIGKYFAIGASYLALLIAVTTGVAVLSFLLL